VTDHARDIFDADAAEYRKYKYSNDVCRLDWHSFESRRQCVARLLPEEASTVLDLGCGSGTYLPLLASRCDRLLAQDFSPAMIDEARKACADLACTYMVGDAAAIPLEADSVDLVNCIGVLEYLPEPGRCLAEVCRVLRLDGVLVVSVPNARSLWRLAERCYGPLLRRLRSLLGRRRDEQKMDSFPRTLYTEHGIRRLLGEAGLTVEAARYYNHRLPFVGAIWGGLSIALSRCSERRSPAWLARRLGGGVVLSAAKFAATGASATDEV
jgi:ubiquinone/menaquinone biosynthesis C-methylase UbiE